MEFQKEIPTTENRLKVITKRFSCDFCEGESTECLAGLGGGKPAKYEKPNRTVRISTKRAAKRAWK